MCKRAANRREKDGSTHGLMSSGTWRSHPAKEGGKRQKFAMMGFWDTWANMRSKKRASPARSVLRSIPLWIVHSACAHTHTRTAQETQHRHTCLHLKEANEFDVDLWSYTTWVVGSCIHPRTHAQRSKHTHAAHAPESLAAA